MPAANLLALLDDIASVLDDVAAFSKLAAKKTAGVLGDDLALNAQQVAGVQASRELPVIWAVARGSWLGGRQPSAFTSAWNWSAVLPVTRAMASFSGSPG